MFLKSIIDNLYNVDAELKLTFDQLFGKFAEIYWNLVLKYELRQKRATADGRVSSIERVLKDSAIEYGIIEPIPYESLKPEQMIKITTRVKRKCKENVVGALFEDTRRLFYSFSKEGEWIQINPEMYSFICKHKTIIEKNNYYEWAKFLEKVNEEDVTTKILSKIDASSRRNNLTRYRQILFDEFERKTCFYCGKKLKEDDIHVDHFIPWSFIKDDNLWNLVLSCKACNLNKKDKLPDLYFLSKIEQRNCTIVVETHKADMVNYRSNKIRTIYDWARTNGYDDNWVPKAPKIVIC